LLRRERLDAQRAVVCDVVERVCHGRPVDVIGAGCSAIAGGGVRVRDVRAGQANRIRRALLLDVHVIRVEQEPERRRVDGFHDLEALLGRVDQARLVPVEGLERELQSALARMVRDRAQRDRQALERLSPLVAVEEPRAADGGVHRPADDRAADSPRDVDAGSEELLRRANPLVVHEQVTARRHGGAETRAEPMLGNQLGRPSRVRIADVLDRELDRVEPERADLRHQRGQPLVGERREPDPRVRSDRVHVTTLPGHPGGWTRRAACFATPMGPGWIRTRDLGICAPVLTGVKVVPPAGRSTACAGVSLQVRGSTVSPSGGLLGAPVEEREEAPGPATASVDRPRGLTHSEPPGPSPASHRASLSFEMEAEG
jgi:hypothetical protein